MVDRTKLVMLSDVLMDMPGHGDLNDLIRANQERMARMSPRRRERRMRLIRERWERMDRAD